MCVSIWEKETWKVIIKVLLNQQNYLVLKYIFQLFQHLNISTNAQSTKMQNRLAEERDQVERENGKEEKWMCPFLDPLKHKLFNLVI